MFVFKLKNKLQIETIEEIVGIYKDERLKYDGLFLLYSYLNKQISDKSMLLTSFINLNDDINNKIILKNKMLIEDTAGENNSLQSQKIQNQVKQVIEEKEVVKDFINKNVDKIRSVFEMLKRHNTQLDMIINKIKDDYNMEDNEKIKINKTKKVKYDEYIEIKNIEDWTAVDSKIILTSI